MSVLKAIRAQLPDEDVVYLGDQVHVPYGPRPLDEVCAFSDEITRFLLGHDAKLIVVACNSASAAALPVLRRSFPQVPFVGMEPAVKPAAEQTHSGVVGVLATPATFQGALYASVIERFAHDVKILQSTCPGLVTQIEKGALDAPETESILRQALSPMLEQGIDTVVLGCTHYPFVIPLIERIVGSAVRVIDPAPAIARQVRRLLEAGLLCHPAQQNALITYYTSAAAEDLQSLLPLLLGAEGSVGEVHWVDGHLKRQGG